MVKCVFLSWDLCSQKDFFRGSFFLHFQKRIELIQKFKMGLGLSINSNVSEEQATANITQRYSGTCDIECDNTIDNTNITIINSNVEGNVGLTQACSVNGQCIFNATTNAVNDVFLKANGSTNASNAAPLLGIGIDIASSYSSQTINQNVSNKVLQKCNVVSLNQMDNINIYASDSNISGNVGISQSGNVAGGCSLSSVMSAATHASATANNCSISGKKGGKKKCSAGKGGTSKGGSIGIILGVLAFIVVGILVYKNFIAPKTGNLNNPGVSTK